MQKQCVVIRGPASNAGLSSLIEDAECEPHEIDGEKLDERDILAILADRPFAIVLPLSLRRYASLRIAELIALRRLDIRLILVSGTRAAANVLEDLFDCFLPTCADGLIEALRQRDWTHAFDRRRVTIDIAMQRILSTACCFWLSGGRHPETFATLVDYQRSLVESSRQFTVLFLASDPSDLARLRLMKELSEIQHELTKRSDYSFVLKYVFSSRPDELARTLLEEKPHIVHFCGHGDANGRLCFEDGSGRSWPADKSAIAQIFEPMRRHVKCVLLNACFSAEQAQLLGEYVEYAAGMTSAVSDEAAISMARGFYGALSVSGRVSDALTAARANLKLRSEKVQLFCARRIPAFRGFAPQAIDPVELDPMQPARSEEEIARLVADDVVVPIPVGVPCDARECQELIADENDSVGARFVVMGSQSSILAFYTRWIERNGWFVEGRWDCDWGISMRLARGMHRIRLVIAERDNQVWLAIGLEQTRSARLVRVPP
jgi:hypothetical protein